MDKTFMYEKGDSQKIFLFADLFWFFFSFKKFCIYYLHGDHK